MRNAFIHWSLLVCTIIMIAAGLAVFADVTTQHELQRPTTQITTVEPCSMSADTYPEDAQCAIWIGVDCQTLIAGPLWLKEPGTECPTPTKGTQP